MVKHKSVLILATMILPNLAIAEGKVKTNPYLDWAYENIIFLMGVVVVLGAGLTLWNVMNGLVEYQKRAFLQQKGIVYENPKSIKKDSWFNVVYDKAWSLVPLDKEADIELGHSYDGIRELDNRLPPWWVWTFYITIFIGIAYLYVYHVSNIGISQHEEYVAEIAKGEKERVAFAARQKNAIDEKNLVEITDIKELEIAQEIYLKRCSTCHGPDGQGGVGPNITDNYWIHGGSISDIYSTIKYGVPQKGMIAWKEQLQPSTILKLASYIKTLQGTNPPNPKAREGELYEEVLTATIQE